MTDQHLKLTGNLLLDTMAFASAANVIAFITLSDPVQLALISAVCSLLTVIVSGGMALILRRVDGRVTETQEKVEVIKNQTDGIASALAQKTQDLVKKTEDEALLRGEMTGRDKAEARAITNPAPAPAPVATTETTVGTIELKGVLKPPTAP